MHFDNQVSTFDFFMFTLYVYTHPLQNSRLFANVVTHTLYKLVRTVKH